MRPQRAAAALAVLLLSAGVAVADDGSLSRRMGFAERGKNLVVTTSFP